jgi:hypothetical protein
VRSGEWGMGGEVRKWEVREAARPYFYCLFACICGTLFFFK